MANYRQDASLTWEDVKFLKSITKLPIWVKGIMTEEDAVLALEHGVDGIFVSNHGGRQLDGAPPTLRVLSRIAKAVNKRVPVVRASYNVMKLGRGRLTHRCAAFRWWHPERI